MKQILFSLGGMAVGAGLMFIVMQGEVKEAVKPEPFVCSTVTESMFEKEAIHNLWHCQTANMSCGLSAGGISCVKKNLTEKLFSGM